jgi:GGDEF domain-containing protein
MAQHSATWTHSTLTTITSATCPVTGSSAKSRVPSRASFDSATPAFYRCGGEELLRRTDAALYVARARGRNRVAIEAEA